jgi:hypothetical protein
MASVQFTRSVPSQGTIFVFSSWVYIADGAGNFRRFLVDMKPKTPAADLRSDLDKFVDDLDDLTIHASAAKVEVESTPGATSSGAAATSLGLDRSNLRIRVTDPNSVHAIWPLIFRRPTSPNPSLH